MVSLDSDFELVSERRVTYFGRRLKRVPQELIIVPQPIRLYLEI